MTKEVKNSGVGIEPALPWYKTDPEHPKYVCAGASKINTVTKIPGTNTKSVMCVDLESNEKSITFSMPEKMELPIFVKDGAIFRCYIASPKSKMDNRGKLVEDQESDYKFILEFKVNDHKVWLPVHMLTREV